MLTAIHAILEMTLHLISKIFGCKVTDDEKREQEQESRRSVRRLIVIAISTLAVGSLLLTLLLHRSEK
jgi:hypothetical protein